MDKIIGLREEKKAKLKLNILNTLIELIKEKPFSQIKVIELCEFNGISEVTFFKYFEKKEEILLFFMLVWNFKRELRLEKEGRKRGLEGIYEIFRDIAETENSLCIMISLVSFISNCIEPPKKIILSQSEKYIISQSEEYLKYEAKEIDQQLFIHLNEAVSDEKIKAGIEFFEIITILSDIFYGVPIVSHMCRSGDLYGDYRIALDRIFSSLIL
jgi:hypothetical protein